MTVYGIMVRNTYEDQYEADQDEFLTDCVFDNKAKAFAKCVAEAKSGVAEYEREGYDWKPSILINEEAASATIDYVESKIIYFVVELEVK